MQFVLLHGHDSRPGALLPIADALRAAPALAECDVRLLTGLHRLRPDQGWAWWTDDDHIPAATAWLSDQLQDDTIVIGFSQGGALAVALGATGHQLVCGVVSIGGFAPEGVDVSTMSVPLLLIHGENDEVVDAMYAEHLAKRVRMAGGSVDVLMHNGAHELPTSFDPLVDWCVTQMTVLQGDSTE
jgi:pimeloyl-ACP methyl ester carboxylesterase